MVALPPSELTKLQGKSKLCITAVSLQNGRIAAPGEPRRCLTETGLETQKVRLETLSIVNLYIKPF